MIKPEIVVEKESDTKTYPWLVLIVHPEKHEVWMRCVSKTSAEFQADKLRELINFVESLNA